MVVASLIVAASAALGPAAASGSALARSAVAAMAASAVVRGHETASRRGFEPHPKGSYRPAACRCAFNFHARSDLRAGSHKRRTIDDHRAGSDLP